MLTFIKNMLSSSTEVSAMRVMSFIALFIAGYLAVHGMNTGRDLNALAVLCTVFAGAAFGGKIAQKFAEKDKE